MTNETLHRVNASEDHDFQIVEDANYNLYLARKKEIHKLYSVTCTLTQGKGRGATIQCHVLAESEEGACSHASCLTKTKLEWEESCVVYKAVCIPFMIRGWSAVQF